MTFSTDHDRLLVPEGWEGHDAYRAGAERREILRHSWDVAVDVEYWSRTLTVGSQLCKEYNYTPLWGSCQGVTFVPLIHHPCTQEFPEQVSDIPVGYSFLDRFD